MSADIEAFFVYGLPAYAFRGFNLKKPKALFPSLRHFTNSPLPYLENFLLSDRDEVENGKSPFS